VAIEPQHRIPKRLDALEQASIAKGIQLLFGATNAEIGLVQVDLRRWWESRAQRRRRNPPSKEVKKILVVGLNVAPLHRVKVSAFKKFSKS
jgi:hypothetical protein